VLLKRRPGTLYEIEKTSRLALPSPKSTADVFGDDSECSVNPGEGCLFK